MHSSSSCAPRRIFVDLGANWCNTLKLYEQLPAQWTRALPTTRWEVYAFEASPLITPFVEQCARELSAGRELPVPPVVPAGSTKELIKLQTQASICPSTPEALGIDVRNLSAAHARQAVTRQRRECALRASRRGLARLKSDPALYLPEVLAGRLASARGCRRAGNHGHAMVTLLPAAAGATNGSMLLWGTNEDLVSGGLTSERKLVRLGSNRARHKVPVVDVAAWLLASFKETDIVVLKIDIEGAEHALIPRLIASNATRLLDAVLWECHRVTGKSSCRDHQKALEMAKVPIVLQEPYNFDGWAGVFAPVRHRCKTGYQIVPGGTKGVTLSACQQRCVEMGRTCGAVLHRASGGVCDLLAPGSCAGARQGPCMACFGTTPGRCQYKCLFVRTTPPPPSH